MFTDSIARSASEIATQNAVKAMREVDLDRQITDRQVHVTLVGGQRLNSGRSAAPRPVQTCVYIVQVPDWRPPAGPTRSDCVTHERDLNVIASERRVVAPNQIQQLQFKASGLRDLWLLIDADFAQPQSDYVPLRLRIEGHGMLHLAAWVDGSGIYDGRQPLPLPPPTEAHSDTAPASIASNPGWRSIDPAPSPARAAPARAPADGSR